MTFSKLSSLALKTYGLLVIAFFLSSADLYLGRVGLIPPPTMFCLGAFLPLVLFAVMRDFFFSRQPETFALLRRNATAVICFGLIALFSVIFAFHPGAYWDEDGRWIFLILYGYVIFLMSIYIPVLEEIRNIFKIAAICGLAVLGSSILTDLFFPGTFSNLMARAAGFPRNSNWAALSTVMVCCACVDPGDQRRIRKDIFVFLLASIAVFSTLSRSGMLELITAFCLYCYYCISAGGVKVKKVLIVLGAVFCFLLLVVTVGALLIEHTEMFTKYKTRFANIGTSSNIDDGSTEHRLQAIEEALVLISKAPVLGHGTAHTRTMLEAPHNMLLMQWVNNGIFGILSYLLLLFLSMRTFYVRRYYPGQMFIAAVMVGTFFSHNIIDQRPFLIILGMMWTLSLYQSARE